MILNTIFIYFFTLQTGQKHRGFIGFLERLLDQASPHIWFDRTLITDREGVSRRYIF